MDLPYGYVYRIRNKINNKTYVGQRKLALDKRWRQYMGSGVAVKAAIAKHGSDSFAKELVAYASTYDELNKIEVKLILEERAAGKAEYNLHIGSPAPYDPTQPFKNLTPEEKAAVFEGIAEQTRERGRLKFQEAIRGQEEVILSLYSEYRSCKKVAEQMDISNRYVKRFLLENGVEFNYQNVKGRAMDEDQKKRISDGLKQSTVRFKLECNQCKEPFESKTVKTKRCPSCSLLPVKRTKYRKRPRPTNRKKYQQKRLLPLVFNAIISLNTSLMEEQESSVLSRALPTLTGSPFPRLRLLRDCIGTKSCRLMRLGGVLGCLVRRSGIT